MPTNESIVEVVRFEAAGLDAIHTRSIAFAKELEAAKKKASELAEALGSAAFARHASRMAEINRQVERNTLALKNQQRAADLASGAFGRHAAAMARLAAESRKLDQREALAGLVAQHGRLGGVIRYHAAELSMLGRTMAGVTGLGLAMGAGLAHSGLQGTVEGVRLEYAWTRLARQLAAVAIPVIEKVANALHGVARWFEGLSGPQQAFLSKLALIAVVAGPAIVALRTLIKVGAAAFAIGRTALATAGLSAAATSGAVAAATATAPTAAAGGAAGGAAAGAAGGLAAGAAGGLAARMGVGRGLMSGAEMAAKGGLGAAEAAGAGAAGGLLSRAKSLGKFAITRALPIGLALEGGEELLNPDGFYERHRRKGGSRLGSGIRTAGNVIENLFRGGGLADDLRAKGELGPGLIRGGDAASDKERRRITPFGAASEEAGAAHFRIQEELMKVSLMELEEKKKEAEARAAAIKALEEEAEIRRRLAEALDFSDGLGGKGGLFNRYLDMINSMR